MLSWKYRRGQNHKEENHGHTCLHRCLQLGRMLYSPGSSLGGARPKANVIDEKGDLWIAKFPSHHDNFDVGAWEYIVTSMALDFGLRVPQIDARLFSSRYHTFMTKHFDRHGINKRLYFVSAMTTCVTMVSCSPQKVRNFLLFTTSLPIRTELA